MDIAQAKVNSQARELWQEAIKRGIKFSYDYAVQPELRIDYSRLLVDHGSSDDAIRYQDAEGLKCSFAKRIEEEHDNILVLVMQDQILNAAIDLIPHSRDSYSPHRDAIKRLHERAETFVKPRSGF